MSPKKLKPGVFVQEVDPTQPVCTWSDSAMPVFVGYTEHASENGNDLTNIPTQITSLKDFRRLFGGPSKPDQLTVTVDLNGRPIQSVVKHRFVLDYALQLFFAEGGMACDIVSVGPFKLPSAPDLSSLSKGVNALKQAGQTMRLLAFPDAVGLSDLELGELQQQALGLCAADETTYAIFDVGEYADLERNVAQFRRAVGSQNLKYGAAYTPYLNADLELYFQYDSLRLIQQGVDISLRDLCQHMGVDQRDVLAYDEALKDPRNSRQLARLEQTLRQNNAFYQNIATFVSQQAVPTPPSGAVAAVYAKTDRDRGVWKAPANVALNSVSGLTQTITNLVQEDLNLDPTSGISINAIRDFDTRGILIWGARTLAGNDPEWRYIPTVRLSMHVQQAVSNLEGWVARRNNDAATWSQIKTSVVSMLHTLWQQGAMQGVKPAEAYFVSVGLGLTMTAQDIQQGIVRLDVGFAPLKPAEFMVLRFVFKSAAT